MNKARIVHFVWNYRLNSIVQAHRKSDLYMEFDARILLEVGTERNRLWFPKMISFNCLSDCKFCIEHGAKVDNGGLINGFITRVPYYNAAEWSKMCLSTSGTVHVRVLWIEVNFTSANPHMLNSYIPGKFNI